MLTGDSDEVELAARRIRLLESVVLSSSDAVIVTTAEPHDEPNIVYVNAAFSRIYGYTAEDVVGGSIEVLRAPAFAPDVRARVSEAHRLRVPLTVEGLHRRANGDSFWCEASHAPVLDASGACDSWVVIARDVTERRRIDQMQLHRSELLELIATDASLERIFAALVRTAERARPGAAVAIALRQGDGLSVTARGTMLHEALEDLPVRVMLPDAHDLGARAIAAGQQVLQVKRDPGGDALYRDFMARHAITACWATPIRIGADEIRGTFTMYVTEDVTPALHDLHLGNEFAQLAGIAIERRRDRQQLEFLAHHDALTQLPNRRLFDERARTEIARAASRGRRVAIGILDLDRFKVVNDSFGHGTGDQLLREVAGRLARFERAGDTVARLGGDEFVVLFSDIADRDEAAKRARHLLAGLGPSFNCADQEVFVRASMGLSVYPDDARELDVLLALCDGAMYVAKTRGREIAFHEGDDHRDAASRIALETSLAHALERGEFAVVYQPQVDLRTRAMHGAEALLRWNHAPLGDVFPESFVRAAEDTGLIVPLGAWVLEEACRFGRRLQDAGTARFVAVNVSARQFDRPDFVELVTRTLARTGLEAARLHLELTESLVMRSPETAAATLTELKKIGVKIVIDDFGTGYSSFSYLKRFPLDAFKIDRLFLREIGLGRRAPSDEAIVRAIVGVARALDLQIVAEGVENEDQVAFLRAIGVPLAQGFLFAPGLSADEALDWKSKPIAR